MFYVLLSFGLTFHLLFSEGVYTETGSIVSSYEERVQSPPLHIGTSIKITPGARHLGQKIALTFDDGPNPIYTPEILDILEGHGITATFFVLGNRIAQSEKILLRMKNEGFEIGNHSYIHPQLSKIPTPRYIWEVWRTGGMIWSITGKYPTFFRFPYGAEDRRLGYFHSGPVIGWNVDAYDWKAKNPEILASKIFAQTKSGSIILLHDIKKDTLEALPLIIEKLQNEGYRFVSMRDLIGYDPQKDYTNIIFRGASLSGEVRSPKVSPQVGNPSIIHTEENTGTLLTSENIPLEHILTGTLEGEDITF